MKTPETYTPAYSETASSFMALRSAARQGAFAVPLLRETSRVLDCGCGPGSMTCDFARIASSGHVTGIDRESSQLELARERASRLGLANVDVRQASIYELPFAAASFDVVFAHAIFEHLSTPESALAEIFRVLAPGGHAAIRSPDWGGFLMVPEMSGVDEAMRHYAQIQTSNGGDIYVGRKLPRLLREAGFDELRFEATYDCSQPASIIAEYLGLPLSDDDRRALAQWGAHPDAVFAQSWCEIVGRRP